MNQQPTTSPAATAGTSGAAPSRQTARIQRDLLALEQAPLPFIQDLRLTLNDEGLNQLNGVILGPANTPYENGHFRFEIRFTPEYPFRPLEFIFRTAICHPNVHASAGTACHDPLLAAWTPTVTLTAVFQAMYSLLQNPNYEVPVEGDTLPGKSPEMARQWSQEFAQP